MMARRLSRTAIFTTLNPTLGFLSPGANLLGPAASYSPPSRWLASRASSSLADAMAQGSTETKMAAAPNSDGNILEPQGTHYSWYSLKPLSDAAEWGGTPGAYFNKCKEANGGAPVYKMHAGLACIALTDHASGKWFFEQPDTVLDRQVRWVSLSKCCRVQVWQKAGQVQGTGGILQWVPVVETHYVKKNRLRLARTATKLA